VVLLNMRLVAAGPIAEVFTPDNLHQTYGGRLTVLTQATEALLESRAADPAKHRRRSGDR
jgi:manganese/zinc/iron transport system ATP- binding protein